jgi:hypothetical protein
LEQNLKKWLKLAHSWGAVMLLDEADVFLEKREEHDLKRNSLVSGKTLVPLRPMIYIILPFDLIGAGDICR